MRAICPLLLVCAVSVATESKTYPLPADAGTVVVRLDYEGGFRAPGKDGAPPLAILADGTVRVAAAQGILKSRMTANELQELLRFAIVEHRIFDFDAKAVRAEIRKRAGANTPIVLDAADTVIDIVLKRRKVRASFHALAFAARQYPTIRALQDLHAVEKRLGNLVQVVCAGGREQVEVLLRAANGRLKLDHPAEPPLEVTDLIRANRWKNGGCDLLFERRAKGRVLHVSVHAPPTGGPQVQIEVRTAR